LSLSALLAARGQGFFVTPQFSVLSSGGATEAKNPKSEIRNPKQIQIGVKGK
jgi:hypothetical protein